MRFSILFLVPLALAAPTTTQKAQDTFMVSNLEAYMTTNPKSGKMNRAKFMTYHPSLQYGFNCNVQTTKSLHSWHPCTRIMGNATDAMSFQVWDGFTQMQMKREWVTDDGMYLTGYATHATYWDDGKDGNVTTDADGKTYEIADPLTFVINEIVA